MWAAPLLIGPVLFSHDAYSYLAQGEILRLGVDPYRNPPSVLAQLGQPHFLAAVSPFWRHTTAPYGPLFVKAVSLVLGVTGAHLIAGVLLVRLLDLAGVVLLAVSVPVLARALGADPLKATWLTALSPLVLLELVAAAHNDALMAGLMAAGVALAVSRRPLPAIALCALAATIKLPALAAVVFIAVAWARTRPDKLRVLLWSALVTAAVGLAVTAITGTGFSWVSSSLVTTPQKVRLAITPATGLGWTIAAVLHDLGLPADPHAWELGLGVAAFVLGSALILGLLWRVRPETLVGDLGLALLIAAVCGPASWPWYLIWGLGLLAAVPAAQRSPAPAAVAVVSVFLVKPDGILALPLSSAPAVLAAYALAAVAWYVAAQRRRRQPSAHRSSASNRPLELSESALVQ